MNEAGRRGEVGGLGAVLEGEEGMGLALLALLASLAMLALSVSASGVLIPPEVVAPVEVVALLELVSTYSMCCASVASGLSVCST